MDTSTITNFTAGLCASSIISTDKKLCWGKQFRNALIGATGGAISGIALTILPPYFNYLAAFSVTFCTFRAIRKPTCLYHKTLCPSEVLTKIPKDTVLFTDSLGVAHLQPSKN